MQTTERISSNDPPPADHPNRPARRINLSRDVRIKLADSEGFVLGCAENVSATGMFVRCQTPRPTGAVVGFEFSLTDGSPLIRGRGEVMWVRHRDAGPYRPAGMGIQFLDLSQQSRQLIAWTVERRTQQQRRHLQASEAKGEKALEPALGPSELEDLCDEVESALGAISDLEQLCEDAASEALTSALEALAVEGTSWPAGASEADGLEGFSTVVAEILGEALPAAGTAARDAGEQPRAA